jgi:uncharacterized protein (TIGR02246 family)
MPTDHERASEIARRMAAAWLDADVSEILSLFAPDGVFISPGGRAQGHAAIAALASSFFAGSYVVEIEIRRVLADGNTGAVEWIWSEASRATSQRRDMEDAIVFELRDGQLIYWREYFDPAQARLVY